MKSGLATWFRKRITGKLSLAELRRIYEIAIYARERWLKLDVEVNGMLVVEDEVPTNVELLTMVGDTYVHIQFENGTIVNIYDDGVSLQTALQTYTTKFYRRSMLEVRVHD